MADPVDAVTVAVEDDPTTDPAETAGVETTVVFEEFSFSSSPKLSLTWAGDFGPPASAIEELLVGARTGEEEGLAKIPSETAF